jgi:hypothetical protein
MFCTAYDTRLYSEAALSVFTYLQVNTQDLVYKNKYATYLP